MIHHRQCLALGFKPADYLLRIHAQLDDLQGDTTLHRLLLLRHVDHAKPAFANLLQQFVASSQCSVRACALLDAATLGKHGE